MVIDPLLTARARSRSCIVTVQRTGRLHDHLGGSLDARSRASRCPRIARCGPPVSSVWARGRSSSRAHTHLRHRARLVRSFPSLLNYLSRTNSGLPIALKNQSGGSKMIVLCNRFGESFSFSTHTWKKVLTIASGYGWKPSGTIAPTKTWDLDHPEPVSLTWDGNYSRPTGQTVRPDDAQSLGEAIERALAAHPQRATKRDRLRAFTIFCRDRGFILSKFFSTPANGSGTSL